MYEHYLGIGNPDANSIISLTKEEITCKAKCQVTFFVAFFDIDRLFHYELFLEGKKTTTNFAHKNLHNITLNSSDNTKKNQIDHFLKKKK